MEMSMLKLTNPVKFTSTDDFANELDTRMLIINLNEDFTSFSSFYEKNKIYFNEESCLLMEQIRSTIHQAIWDYHEHDLYKKMGEDDLQFLRELRKKMINAYGVIKSDIPILRKNLESDFRKILSVD